MGATHHAIEDYGVLLTLPGMKVYVPAFDDDIAEIIAIISGRNLSLICDWDVARSPTF